MRIVIFLALCVLANGTAVGLSGCGDDLPADAAAKVGDTTISTAAVQRRVTRLVGGRGSPEARRARAVRDLILSEWVVREAKRRNLHGSGATPSADAVQRLRSQLLAGVKVTETDVERYYAAHRSEYGPPRARASWFLRVRTLDLAKRSRANLAAGDSWEHTLDRARAEDRTMKGDALPFAEHAFRDKHFGRVLFATGIEQIVGPFKTPYGYYLLEPISEQPWSPKPLAEDRSAIADRARAAKLERALHDRYGGETDCAQRFRVPAVPECA
jgi:hypothetical protein